MTQPSSNPWDLGGGGESFPFDNVGDEIEGFIQEMSERQGTDFDGEPDWWDDAKTRPKMLTLIVLQTNLRENPTDDGMRTVTLSGGKKPFPDGGKSRMCAAITAVKAATGAAQMQFNGWFKMKFVAEGPRTKPGFNPPKYYEAWYRPPVMDLDGANRTAPSNEVPQTYGAPATTAPGQNWPAEQSGGPDWAQSNAVNTQTGEIQGGAPAQGAPVTAGGPITAAQIAGLKAANVDPALVYGADWQSRVIP